MLKKLLTKLGEQTALAIVLRRIVEFGFQKQQQAIRTYLPVSLKDRILDIGCGTGEFAPLFPKESYTGVDLDPANIDYASRHYPHHFVVGNATKLSFPDAYFDAVLISGVLHHLSDTDTEHALKEIRRVLKASGKTLIMEDTKSFVPWTALMHRLDQGAYIRSKTEWDMIMKKHFTVEKTWTFGSGICFYSAYVLS